MGEKSIQRFTSCFLIISLISLSSAPPPTPFGGRGGIIWILIFMIPLIFASLINDSYKNFLPDSRLTKTFWSPIDFIIFAVATWANKGTWACASIVFSHLRKFAFCARDEIHHVIPTKFQPGAETHHEIRPLGRVSARVEISLRTPGWNFVEITWWISAQAQNANLRGKIYWGVKTQLMPGV